MILPHRTILLLSLGLAAVLAFSSAAIAAPAGDEYLPKVPDAAGNQAAGAKGGGDLNSGTGETTSGSSETAGSDTGATTKAEGDRDQKGKKADEDRDDSKTAPATGTRSSGGGGGGSSGLIVLVLIVAAVIVVAGGMILRHRAGLTEGEGEDHGDGPGPGGTPSARPTPDGEIVAGREKI
jgi:cobalamin biosynthesis Mg chelatase CobN